MSYYDIQSVTDYIRRAAAARGIDPDTAVRVAQTEGLARNTWQSNIFSDRNGQRVREPSFGPFQMLVGGGNTGFPTGLGNEMINRFGIDPSDPANVYHTIDFALDTVANDGWRQWYGARDNGIGRWQGVRGDGRQARALGPENWGSRQMQTAQAQPVPTPPARPEGLLQNASMAGGPDTGAVSDVHRALGLLNQPRGSDGPMQMAAAPEEIPPYGPTRQQAPALPPPVNVPNAPMMASVPPAPPPAPAPTPPPPPAIGNGIDGIAGGNPLQGLLGLAKLAGGQQEDNREEQQQANQLWQSATNAHTAGLQAQANRRRQAMSRGLLG